MKKVDDLIMRIKNSHDDIEIVSVSYTCDETKGIFKLQVMGDKVRHTYYTKEDLDAALEEVEKRYPEGTIFILIQPVNSERDVHVTT